MARQNPPQLQKLVNSCFIQYHKCGPSAPGCERSSWAFHKPMWAAKIQPLPCEKQPGALQGGFGISLGFYMPSSPFLLTSPPGQNHLPKTIPVLLLHLLNTCMGKAPPSIPLSATQPAKSWGLKGNKNENVDGLGLVGWVFFFSPPLSWLLPFRWKISFAPNPH